MVKFSVCLYILNWEWSPSYHSVHLSKLVGLMLINFDLPEQLKLSNQMYFVYIVKINQLDVEILLEENK